MRVATKRGSTAHVRYGASFSCNVENFRLPLSTNMLNLTVHKHTSGNRENLDREGNKIIDWFFIKGSWEAIKTRTWLKVITREWG